MSDNERLTLNWDTIDKLTQDLTGRVQKLLIGFFIQNMGYHPSQVSLLVTCTLMKAALENCVHALIHEDEETIKATYLEFSEAVVGETSFVIERIRRVLEKRGNED